MAVCGSYLAIFGGRCDQIYPIIKNVALNDLHLFNLLDYSWTPVAMYGDLPSSRWGHKICAAEHGSNKLLLFGGMDL
jgi:hypothetical protein